MAEELTFRSSRALGLFVVVVAWCFLAFGLWRAGHGEHLFGLLCTGLSAVSIPVGLVMLIYPQAMYLRLDQEGFEIGSLIRMVRVKWTDVQGFEMRRVYVNGRVIEIIYAPHYGERKISRAVASAFSGKEGSITNKYNAPLEEILITLNKWRARYGSHSTST